MGNYEEAKEANEQILAQEPENSYANKGLGLSLHRLGQSQEGIAFLQKAITTADPTFLDPYYDLAAVYQELGEPQQAATVLSRLPKASQTTEKV
jgi:tetratricopeptide (TPR) repeat protein